MKTKIASLLGCVLLSLTAWPGLQAAETNPPTVVIYDTETGRSAFASTNIVAPQIAVALWNDGTIVWSVSANKSGPPFKQGKFAREKLAALLDNLERAGAFGDKTLGRPRFGPDSSFTTIAINAGQRRLTMRSWHEGFEQRTNLVATANGIVSLGERKREDVLREQPEDYRQFRQVWSEIRQTVATLIPENGTPFNGQISIPTNL